MKPVARAVGAVLLSVASLSLAPSALAEPTFWQRLERPRAADEAKLLASLERMLDDASRLGAFDFGLDRQLARGAVAMIELSGASEPADPRLACVVAQALVEADIGREVEARRLLEGALRELPPGSRAAAAWNTLARALGHLDDPKAEHQAYTRVIDLTWNPEIRALAAYNRGEVSMRQRHVEAARADYEQAVQGARDPSLVALARYGLAVAEERLGDLPAAYAALDKASAIALPVPPFPFEDPLDLPSVFFLPAYEEHYIRALRAMAAARRTTDPQERHAAYEAALVEWDTFLARSPDDEPFRENARSHRARAEREQGALTRSQRAAVPQKTRKK